MKRENKNKSIKVLSDKNNKNNKRKHIHTQKNLTPTKQNQKKSYPKMYQNTQGEKKT